MSVLRKQRQKIGEQNGLSQLDPLGMASLVVDLRITQIVNGVFGVHAMLPHGAIQRRRYAFIDGLVNNHFQAGWTRTFLSLIEISSSSSSVMICASGKLKRSAA